jgi:hypothetical protein
MTRKFFLAIPVVTPQKTLRRLHSQEYTASVLV